MENFWVQFPLNSYLSNFMSNDEFNLRLNQKFLENLYMINEASNTISNT